MAKDFEVIRIDVGNAVICDLCGDDYTDSTESGGIFFTSKAICPKCTPDMEKSIKEYGEEEFVRSRCPADKSFADWVRQDLR